MSTNKLSALHAINKIAIQAGNKPEEITSIRPEDGSGNKWLYILAGSPTEYYIDLVTRQINIVQKHVSL